MSCQENLEFHPYSINGMINPMEQTNEVYTDIPAPFQFEPSSENPDLVGSLRGPYNMSVKRCCPSLKPIKAR